MSFIEELEKTAHKTKNGDLEYLKNSDLPLVLYGAGKVAMKIKVFLEKHCIKIDFVAVDKEYWQSDMKFGEFDVLPLEDVLASNCKVNIVVAFFGWDYAKVGNVISSLNENTLVQKCLYFSLLTACFIGQLSDTYMNFVNKNSAVFADLYNKLSDDLSRKIMLEYIIARSIGDAKELAKLVIPNEAQYFPDFLYLSDKEVLVDCGAYIGDTINVFLSKTNKKHNKIFAFEPFSSSAEKCRKVLVDGDVLIEKGVWNEKTSLCIASPQNHDAACAIAKCGDMQIELDSIDNVLGKEKATFIKMDIEGSELKALMGAENQIRKNKPKLAVCVYHREEDLITIPQYILSLNPNYKLYLRHYGGNSCTELVLYAVDWEAE